MSGLRPFHPQGAEWRDAPGGALFDGKVLTLIHVSRLMGYDEPGDVILAPLSARAWYAEWRGVVLSRGEHVDAGTAYGLAVEFRRGAWDLCNAKPANDDDCHTLRTYIADQLYRQLGGMDEHGDAEYAIGNIQRIAELVDWQAAL